MKALASKVLRLPEVRRRVGLSVDSIYRMGRDGNFPRPIKISERASGWLEHEIEDWFAKRTKARDSALTSTEP